jgi:hypothetical protein
MGALFPKKSGDVKNVAQKRAAILTAIACINSGKWIPHTIEDDGNIVINGQDREENELEEVDEDEDEDEDDEDE